MELNFPRLENGNPIPGAVLSYCLDIGGKLWTRQRLADTLNVSKKMIERMLADKTGEKEWDSMKRREAIVKVLAPVVAAVGINKQNLGELFGIVVPDKEPQLTKSTQSFNVHVDIERYEKEYLAYGENHGIQEESPKEILENVLKKIQRIYRALPYTHEKQRLMRLLINQHCFAAMMYQEMTNYQDSAHMLVLARQLADSDKRAYGDLIARSYDLQAGSLIDQKRYLQALSYAEQARQVMKDVPIRESLKTKILCCHADSMIRVGVAKHDQDAVKQGMGTLMRMREQVATRGALVDPEFHIRFDNHRMEMDVAVGFRFTGQYKRSLQSLEGIYLPYQAIRRRAYVEVQRASALYHMEEYTGAAESAINSLELASAASSGKNVSLVRGIYRLLDKSPAATQPEVRKLALALK